MLSAACDFTSRTHYTHTTLHIHVDAYLSTHLWLHHVAFYYLPTAFTALIFYRGRLPALLHVTFAIHCTCYLIFVCFRSLTLFVDFTCHTFGPGSSPHVCSGYDFLRYPVCGHLPLRLLLSRYRWSLLMHLVLRSYILHRLTAHSVPVDSRSRSRGAFATSRFLPAFIPLTFALRLPHRYVCSHGYVTLNFVLPIAFVTFTPHLRLRLFDLLHSVDR